MNMINFLCKASAGIIVCYVIDAILVVGIIGALCYIFYKNYKQKSKGSANEATKTNDVISSESGDVEYVIPSQQNQNAKPAPTINDNKVEHFSNQIFDLSEEASSELKSKVVSKPRKPEVPVKRVMKDETINLSEKSTGPVKVSSFQNTTDLLSTLKSEQNKTRVKQINKPAPTPQVQGKVDAPSEEPVEEQVHVKIQSLAKKPTAKSGSVKTSETAPQKRKYTKRKTDEN